MRALTEQERALLDALLASDFAGAAALREQARHVQAGKGCRCGCGTIDLVPDRSRASWSEAAGRAPLEYEVVDDAGEPVGGVLLFFGDGWLSLLEVYSWDDPLPLPPPERVVRA